MAGSIIVVDSSPEPDDVGPRIQASPASGRDTPNHEMEAQAQSSSSRDKGKQKAPAPVVYEISSDDSQTPPTYDQDSREVQSAGMHSLVTATVVKSMEESKKRKRGSGSGPADSCTGSGSGLAVASSSAEDIASYSMAVTGSSYLNPAFASSSAVASRFTPRINVNVNAAAGPSGLNSASSMSLPSPVVKKARFETDPVTSIARTGSTTTVKITTAAVPTVNVEHVRSVGPVASLDRATAGVALTVNGHKAPALARLPANIPANAPRHVHGVHPPGINAHPPGPYYEGALLPPGHFYHDALNLRAPPAAHTNNSKNVTNNGANNAANNAVNNLDNGAADFLHQLPRLRGHNAIEHHDPAALAARLAANRVDHDERLQQDLAALRERFPGELAVGARYREERERVMRRWLDEGLVRTHEMLGERLRDAEVRRENLQRARERAEERERNWQRLIERDRERERMLGREIERARERRAHRALDLDLLDFGVVGEAGAIGREQGRELGWDGGLFPRNGHVVVGLADVDEPPPLLDFDLLDDGLDLHEPADEALEDALNELNAANVNNANEAVDMAFRNQVNNIRADLEDLDNDLDRIGDGVAHMQGNLDDELEGFDDLVNNTVRNFGDGNLGGGDNHNNGPYANPLFAPPASVPPVLGENGLARDADAVVFDADRDADGHGLPQLGEGDNDNDIYVPVREGRPSLPNPPADRTAKAHAPAVAGGVEPALAVAALPNATAAAFSVDVRSHGGRLEATPQSVAGPSAATANIIDVDAFQHVPASRAAAHSPVAGPSNAAGASGSNSPVPGRPVDPIDTILASILEVVPDVLPEHAATLARTHFSSFGVMHTAEHVLGLLLESRSYPRRGKGRKKGKEKSKGKEQKGITQGVKEGAGDEDAGTDFLTTKINGQPGKNYKRLVIYHLRQSFPHARASQLTTASSMRYARGHAFLAERLGQVPLAGNGHNADAGTHAHRHRHRLEEIRGQHYGVAVRAGPGTANDVGAPVNGNWHNATWGVEMDLRMEEERMVLRGVVDKEFAKERRWVERRYGLPKSDVGTGVAITAAAGVEEGVGGPREDTNTGKCKENGDGKGKGKAKEIALADAEDEPVEAGMGVECQCCFAEYAFSRMAQCPETHLFCVSCISRYAAVQLGNMNPSLTCMHADGCAMPFGELELHRVLPRKLMRLYERVLIQKAVEGLEGLEACPFCEWKCVMDVSPEVDRLFRCGNVRGDDDDDDEDECGVVSCRLCKKLDHTPKSCQEAEEDKHLDGQHAVEEAMTAALMRNCPKCKKAFIKEGGCNKMTCPYCGTHSCYTCRKQINGYDHFDLRPLDPGEAVASGKCRTHDTRQLEEIHANEVKAAAEKAIAEYKAAHPDVEDGHIKVDIPEAPPALPPNLPRIRQHDPMLGMLGRQRVAEILAGNHNMIGNAPRNGIGGDAAVAFVPGQGAARLAYPPVYPAFGQAAREHLARLAAHGAHLRLLNGAGNAQPAAAAAVGPDPPALPPQRAQDAYFRVPHRFGYGADPMRHIGRTQPQDQNGPPPQDIVMDDAPLRNDHDQLLRQRRVLGMIDAVAARGHAQVAAAPQPQAPAPPAPLPYAYPNLFFPRLDAPAAPQQPQPQPAPVPHHPIDPYDYIRRWEYNTWRQDGLAPNAPVNPGLGRLELGPNRAYPGMFSRRPARQENVVAGPAYPGTRALGDQPATRPQPQFVPPVPHLPAPVAFQVPIPAPAFHDPQAPAGNAMGMDMGMGFGPAMDVDMDMGFGAGMGARLNTGVYMGAGGVRNTENRPANLSQGQGDAARDAGGHHLAGPY